MLRIADTFVVERPSTVDAAIALLEQYGDDARIVAGGTDIIPNIKHGLHAPKALIDLKAVDGLRSLVFGDEFIELGALVPIHKIGTSAEVKSTLLAWLTPLKRSLGLNCEEWGHWAETCVSTPGVCISIRLTLAGVTGFLPQKDGTQCHVVTVESAVSRPPVMIQPRF